MRRTLWSILVAGAVPVVLLGQDSQFGVRALGHPGRQVSARARGSAGAFGPFDPTSGLNPGAIGRIDRLTATGVFASTFRGLDGPNIDGSLRTTRFPLVKIISQFFWRFNFSLGFATYLDRSYEVTTVDTIPIRGTPVSIVDQVRSDGGVSDIEIALGRRLSNAVSVGASIHGIAGSARVRVARAFGDSSFAAYEESSTLRYSGAGVSVGSVVFPTARLVLSLYARSDTRLKTSERGVELGRADLPVTVGGGLLLSATDQLRLAAAAEWRSWSDAAADVQPNGSQAFNTFEGALGAEVVGGTWVVRLGARRAQLPFGPAEQPTEFDLAAGFGFGFSGGRGRLDFALERAWRSDDALDERLWTVVVGLTVRP